MDNTNAKHTILWQETVWPQEGEIRVTGLLSRWECGILTHYVLTLQVENDKIQTEVIALQPGDVHPVRQAIARFDALVKEYTPVVESLPGERAYLADVEAGKQFAQREAENFEDEEDLPFAVRFEKEMENDDVPF